ncbi:hypothetical protein [Saliterribacillus persicus]|uniref:YesK-like protein n=1 Tax=Saliterribacillus persicus TaxID=930114 RepID=A0A368XV77_9BACI|nr:hypothetical protein [Saliterribacillus persicus]RCW71873.1 hypothetical protein DFR57_10556 [Saliterribacillus persicus]
MGFYVYVVLPWIFLILCFIGFIISVIKRISFSWGFLCCMIGIIIYLIGTQMVGGFDGMAISLIGALPFTIGLFVLFILWIGNKIK